MIKLDYLYFGIVENVDDPILAGRVQVRIFGIHSESIQELPTELLPWCQCWMPVDEPFISGIGWSPTGIVPGAMVVLIPQDEFKQEWKVMFSTGAYRTNLGLTGSDGFRDPEGLYPLEGRGHDVNFIVRGRDVKIDGVVDNGFDVNAEKRENSTTTEVEKPMDDGGETVTEEVPVGEATWMKVAEAQLGVNEKDNPAKITEYHTKGGGSSRWGGETPWCASFVGWCFNEVKIKGSGSAMARSYLKWGKELPINTNIPYGAVIVIKGNRGPSSGHVCFATGVSNNRVQVIGGNQSAKNKQNGGEVTSSSFAMSEVIGVRWPSDVAVTKENPKLGA